MINQNTIDRFWSRVCKTSDCWFWTGCTANHGYGEMSVNGRTTAMHRLSWIIHFGAIPEGKWVLHKCDNPSCVRPDHLFLGTHLDNMSDMVKKERQWKGPAYWNAKLNDNQVLEIRRIWDARKMTQVKLAKLFNISQPMISKIVRNQFWKHCTPTASNVQSEH